MFTAILTISGQTLVWPKECNEILEIEIAQKIIQSELLVQEDQVTRLIVFINLLSSCRITILYY
jgi:hypothetical protein